MVTLLSMYVYQAFGLANVKALMQTGEIEFITVHDVDELSPFFFNAAARKQNKFRN